MSYRVIQLVCEWKGFYDGDAGGIKMDHSFRFSVRGECTNDNRAGERQQRPVSRSGRFLDQFLD